MMLKNRRQRKAHGAWKRTLGVVPHLCFLGALMAVGCAHRGSQQDAEQAKPKVIETEALPGDNYAQKALFLYEVPRRPGSIGSAPKVFCAYRIDYEGPSNPSVLGMLSEAFGPAEARREPGAAGNKTEYRVTPLKVAGLRVHHGFTSAMLDEGIDAAARSAKTSKIVNVVKAAFDAVALVRAIGTQVTSEPATQFEREKRNAELSRQVSAVQDSRAQCRLSAQLELAGKVLERELGRSAADRLTGRQLVDDEVFEAMEQAIGSIKETQETKQMVCPKDPRVIAQQIARLRGDACPRL